MNVPTKDSTKRAHSPSLHRAETPALNQPAAKKQDTRARSLTPKHELTAIKQEAKDASSALEDILSDGEGTVKDIPGVGIKKEANEQFEGDDTETL